MTTITIQEWAVKTRTIKSDSNYTKAVSLWKDDELVCGTILHEDTTEEQVKQWGLQNIPL